MNIRCTNPRCQEIFKGNKKSKFCSNECKKDYFNFPYEEHTLSHKKKYLKTIHPYCADCKIRNRYVLQVHHILPICKNGSDMYNNLIVLCANCHVLRHLE